MKSFTFSFASLAATALTAALLPASVHAGADPIVIKGQHFFYKTSGSQFFIRGVAYQKDAGGASTDIVDPLADEAGCSRDIPLLKQLNTNVVRVYAIDPSADHSKCMSELADAGIYVIQDLSTPKNSINRNDPEWNVDIFAGYAKVIDEMAQYDNTLGFFAGNEVSNERNNTAASAYVKAAVRDSKAYIKARGYRSIGVGYATNDDADIRTNLANYFNCGPAEDAIDFWGYNVYSWCGKSDFTTSGYKERTEELSNYTVPAFFAEYGCIEPRPRLFEEVDTIYSSKMTDVWSGAIVYMYFEEENAYGLVSVDGSSASKLGDFTSLSKHINAIKPSSTAASAYSATNTVARACPTVGSDWNANSALPPIANSDACECMLSSLDCITAKNASGDDISKQLGYICGTDPAACKGIDGNATTGKYGAYSMCNGQQKLAFAFNQYYLNQNKNSKACDFNGLAKTQSGHAKGSCATLVSAAGSAGTGVITAVPTAATARSVESHNAADAVRSDALGFMGVSAYLTAVLATGMGMIVL